MICDKKNQCNREKRSHIIHVWHLTYDQCIRYLYSKLALASAKNIEEKKQLQFIKFFKNNFRYDSNVFRKSYQCKKTTHCKFVAPKARTFIHFVAHSVANLTYYQWEKPRILFNFLIVPFSTEVDARMKL